MNLGEQGKSLGDLGEADPANRISPVKFFDPTTWGQTASAELCLSSNKFERSESICAKHGGEFIVLSNERSDTSRTVVKGEFISSKPKAHRVKEERGSFVV